MLAYLWTSAQTRRRRFQTSTAIAAWVVTTAINARLTSLTYPAIHTDAQISIARITLYTLKSTGPSARIRKTLVNIRLALTTGKTRTATAPETADKIVARSTILTRQR